MVHCASTVPSQFAAPSGAFRFEIHADRCPQVLPRVLGMFARLDLAPVDLHARRSCGGLWIGLTVEIDAADAERAAEKLRATVGIAAVIVVHPPAAARSAQPRPAMPPVAARRAETRPMRTNALGRSALAAC